MSFLKFHHLPSPRQDSPPHTYMAVALTSDDDGQLQLDNSLATPFAGHRRDAATDYAGWRNRKLGQSIIGEWVACEMGFPEGWPLMTRSPGGVFWTCSHGICHAAPQGPEWSEHPQPFHLLPDTRNMRDVWQQAQVAERLAAMVAGDMFPEGFAYGFVPPRSSVATRIAVTLYVDAFHRAAWFGSHQQVRQLCHHAGALASMLTHRDNPPQEFPL